MTILIADNSPRISYTATSGQTAFTVPFEFFDNTDLNVYINDTLQTLTTHYTVTGGSGSTGSITLVTGATAGDVIVITRDVTLERTTDFPTSGPFQVASLNTELDKVVAMIADMKDLADRGLRLSDSDTSATLVLANKDTRKGTVLAFNETTGAVEVGPTIADTNTIAQIKADIATLADIQDGTVATNAITTVSSISSDVTTVSSNNANVTTVAGQTTNMQNITNNLTAVQNAATNATNAAASATAAASSATAAATSETNAGTSETNAATSATNASNSASAASTSASAASTSATAAASSATAAAASETAAGTSETNAATSATNAATSATNAGTSETNAASSATSAAASATSASAAQTAAESARDSALASFDSFDDRYLGTKTSDPTVDNDGDALVAGALYFNSTDGEMKVYNGTSWVDAYADGASLVSKSGDTMTGALVINADLTVDTNTLHVDSANNVVAVGTTSPSSAPSLHVQGDAEGIRLDGTADTSREIFFRNTSAANPASIHSDGALKLRAEDSGTHMEFHTADTERMRIDSNGTITSKGYSALNSSARDGSGSIYLGGNTSYALLIDHYDAGVTKSVIRNTYASTNSGAELALDSGVITFNTGTSYSEAMRINSSGNVGIGTTSPDANSQLHIKKTGANAKITLETDESNDCYINFSGATAEASIGYEPTSNAIVFANSADGLTTNERLRIGSSGNTEVSGNLTVDNQSPVLQLEADANYSSYVRFSNGSTLQDGEIQYAPAVDTMYFRTNNTSNRMSLDGSGNLTAAGNITAYSDERLKDNIETLDGSKVYEMRGVSFTKDGEAGSGVIAQELQKIAPELVQEGDEYLSVAYGNLVGYLIEAVKDLKAEIEELKNASAE